MRIDGQVMWRNCCQRDAPSTDAASYRSLLIARRPVRRISVQNGSDFQMWTIPAIENAIQRSLSQLGPSSAVILKYSVLMIPHSGFSMKRNDRIVGIDGTAQGRMKSTARMRIHQRSCTKNPERNSASTNFRLTTTSRNSAELTTALSNTGSCHSRT